MIEVEGQKNLEMDSLLYDEILQEIFRRLPPSSSAAVSLVSKRWLYLLRSSTTSLSLRLRHPHVSPAFSSYLNQHPYLSVLSITSAGGGGGGSSDHLIRSIGSSCPNLRRLRFPAGPVSPFSLSSFSSYYPRLCSLAITLCRPLNFRWISDFQSLNELSIQSAANSSDIEFLKFGNIFGQPDEFHDSELSLETLCLSGIRPGDSGLSWLWRNCKKVKTLKLESCEGVGENASFTSFLQLNSLQEVELRTCRSIVDMVLLKLAEFSISLNSLLVYDGGSKEGLLQFINGSHCNLQKLDFRLPLDLDNNHLTAIAEKFRGLTSLRLQSCCLVTGEGLRSIRGEIEELALVKCDVVEREAGLLTTLGQNLRRLRKLDLSYNEMLVDKELISMLVSCNDLSELKLRGCNKITNVAVASMAKSCKRLEMVDIMYCCGIGAVAIEQFVLNSTRLARVHVEQAKLSSVARMWASHHSIEVVA